MNTSNDLISFLKANIPVPATEEVVEIPDLGASPVVTDTPQTNTPQPELTMSNQTEPLVPLSQVEATVNSLLEQTAQEKATEAQRNQEMTQAARQSLIGLFPDAEQMLPDIEQYISEVQTDPTNIASWREGYFARKSASAIPAEQVPEIEKNAAKQALKSIKEKQAPIITKRSGGRQQAKAPVRSFDEAEKAFLNYLNSTNRR